MNIVVKGRHMEVTDSMREYVQGKAAKLPRYYDNITSVEIILDVEADRPVAEVIVQAKRKATFVATHRDDDMYACVDKSIHKVVEQLRRHKDKVRDHQAAPRSEVTEP